MEVIEHIAVRLIQGDDLKHSLQQLVIKHEIKAGYIASCVGSVSQINLRLAGANSTLTLERPYEIVSCQATLTPNHIHCHASFSDQSGQIIGGHLLEKNIIDTTAELILIKMHNHEFTRSFDANTGFTELKIDRNN